MRADRSPHALYCVPFKKDVSCKHQGLVNVNLTVQFVFIIFWESYKKYSKVGCYDEWFIKLKFIEGESYYS